MFQPLFVSYYKFIANVRSKNVSIQPIPEPCAKEWDEGSCLGENPIYFWNTRFEARLFPPVTHTDSFTYSLQKIEPPSFSWIRNDGGDPSLNDHRLDDDSHVACQHYSHLEDEMVKGSLISRITNLNEPYWCFEKNFWRAYIIHSELCYKLALWFFST